MTRLFTLLAASLLASPALAFPVTVDNCGEPLTFDTAPSRMVVQDINMSEMAFALGLQDRMVGVSGISGWYKTSPEFEARRGDIPEIAPKYPTLENLVAVSPDLFFAGWYYGMKPGGDVTPDTLAPHGIKTMLLSESCIHLDKSRPAASLDLLYDDMLRLGTVFGKRPEAEALVAGWKARIAEVGKRIAQDNQPRVFLYDSGEDKPFTAGRFAMPTAMIEAAGGQNVSAGMETSWGTTSWEAVAASDPQFIILLDYQDGGGADKLRAFLEAHPVMRHVEAVKAGRYLALRYEQLTPGPANIDGIEALARAMHPDAF
ncbi:ABC transporter substrate-binding protein [Stappia sp. MMSF_3263]|uniref:ABC transporter substrate-binding protein n=1 Tax=Stappia sp. MMSF_3263 TaxID=3046693 RepID=UPI00273F9743|nr:ABC transporter substrate-binding protein [Stappia sp. MMSF_3263]